MRSIVSHHEKRSVASSANREVHKHRLRLGPRERGCELTDRRLARLERTLLHTATHQRARAKASVAHRWPG